MVRRGKHKILNMAFLSSRHFAHSPQIKTDKFSEGISSKFRSQRSVMAWFNWVKLPTSSLRENDRLWEETKILCTKITGNKSNRVSI